MTFTQLRTFALVAELGSLRAAATALGISEPAVSAAVAALRTDLGDPLFRRTGDRHRPDPRRPRPGRPCPGAGAAGGADPPGGRARDVHRTAPGAGHGGLRRARRGPGRRGLHPPGAARGRGPDRGLDRLRGGRAGGGRRRHRARGPAGADPGAGGRRRAVPALLARGRRGAGPSPGRDGEAAHLRPVRARLAHRPGRAGAGQRGGALGGPRRPRRRRSNGATARPPRSMRCGPVRA